MRAVLTAPLHVALDRDQRIQRFQRRPHRRGELPQARLASGVAHRVQRHAREPLSLTFREDAEMAMAKSAVRLPPALERARPHVVPTGRKVFEASVPGRGQRMELRDELVFVEEGELEVRMGLVEACPSIWLRACCGSCTRGRFRRERALEANLEQVGPVGVADDLHVALSSATA